jgi:DNA polymerase-3 subunit delta'
MTWKLIGHEWAVQLLRGHIEKQSLRHAYLITGPPGIGKKNLAVRFIQAISCPETDRPGIPCLDCLTCQKIGRLEYPDLFPIATAEGSTRIRIDQIRELLHDLNLTPYQGTHRFGLLVDFEWATISAQNSLLKTLEEPPGSVILILTAISSKSILETISSRCEEIKLHPVPIQITSEGLQTYHGIQQDQANFLAHISGGKPELALQYHLDPQTLQERETLLTDHYQILNSNAVERFRYAAKIDRDPDLALKLINLWSGLWHDILLQTGKSSAALQNIDQSEHIQQIANQVQLTSAKETINLFRRAWELLQDNANRKLTIEDLLLQLPRIEI